MPGVTVTNAQILRSLQELHAKVDILMTQQDDINAADTAIESEVADLATNDAAIEAAQAQLLATITGLQGQGVNTAQLVADTAALLQAHGASDATVAALTAAAAPPATP